MARWDRRMVLRDTARMIFASGCRMRLRRRSDRVERLAILRIRWQGCWVVWLGGGVGWGGGGGGGGFRGFNPTQPHGAIFYQGGNGALDATNFSLTGGPVVKPAYSTNRFGLSFTGSPSIPGLVKASTKQFI